MIFFKGLFKGLIILVFFLNLYQDILIYIQMRRRLVRYLDESLLSEILHIHISSLITLTLSV